MCSKPSNNIFNCPRCNAPINESGNRIVVEFCGHQKCRKCFITEESGCNECKALESECGVAIPAINSALVTADLEPPNPNADVTIMPQQKRQKFKILDDIILTAPLDIVESRHDGVAAGQPKSRTSGSTSGKSTIAPFQYPAHIRATTVDNTLAFHCKLCRKSFKSLNHRRYHMYCDPNITKPLKCKVCEKRFITATHLNYHMKGHADQQATFACKLCDRTFLREGSLRKHCKKQHEGDFKYECSVCKIKLQYKFEIDVHKNKHNKTFPFHCEICNKGFLMKSNYKQHLEFHTGARNFSCDMCDKRFAKKSSLKFHLSLHVKDHNKYNCTSCTKSFLCQRSLHRHARIHSDSRCFECPLCHVRSSRKDNMQRHLKDFHPTEDRKALLAKIIERSPSASSLTTVEAHRLANESDDTNITVSTNQPNNHRSVIQFVGRPKTVDTSNSSNTLPSNSKDLASRSYIPSHDSIFRPNATNPLKLELNHTNSSNMKLYMKLLSPYLKPTAPPAEITSNNTATTTSTTFAVKSTPSTSFSYGPEHYNSMMNERIRDVTQTTDTLSTSTKMTSEQLAIYRGILKPCEDIVDTVHSVSIAVGKTTTTAQEVCVDSKTDDIGAENVRQSRNDNFTEMHWRKRTSQCFSQMDYKQ